MNKNFTPLSTARPTLPSPTPAGAPAAPTATTPARPAAASATSPRPTPVFRPLNGTPDGCCAGSTLPGEPKITLEREGDQVTRITIQCTCGHTIELACAY